ncbi:MAG: prepilin peptidase [Pseudomonadota bacterium]
MLAVVILLIIAMCIVMYYDATRFIIPNWLVGSLLLLYPVAFYLSSAVIDWKMDLLGMLGAFAIGYIIFAVRIMGGGDVKLIIVLSLWVGLEKLAQFGFNFAVLGGVLSLIVLIMRGLLPRLCKNKEKLPRIFRPRQPVPYGLAIAGAFLLMMYSNDVPILG